MPEKLVSFYRGTYERHGASKEVAKDSVRHRSERGELFSSNRELADMGDGDEEGRRWI